MSDEGESAASRRRIEELAHREAWFRARTLQEMLHLKNAVKLLTIENRELRALIRARDTTVHELNLARLADRRASQELTNDLETYAHLLRISEEQSRLARSRLEDLRSSLEWRILAPFRSLRKLLRKDAAVAAAHGIAAPTAEPFRYYFHTTPFRIFRAGHVTLRGWLLPPPGRQLTRTRVRVGETVYDVTWGLEEPEVVKEYQLEPPHDRPGFCVTFPVWAGTPQFCLEALLDGARWVTVLATPLRVMPAPPNAEIR
jgi:hypothetical protein